MSSETTPPPVGDQAFTRRDPYGTHYEPMYSGALSFLRRRYTRDLTGVDLAVVGIPYDLAVTNRSGARLGPRAIRAASTQLAWARPWPWTFDPFDRLHVVDYGDCIFDPGRPDRVPDEIEAFLSTIVSRGVVPLCLGGDHFVTYPILKALHARHGALSLIHFDAHCDTWRDDDGRIDHGTMFYHAARLGIVDPARSVQIGMRTVNDETHGYTVLDGVWLHEHGVKACLERILLRDVRRGLPRPGLRPGHGNPGRRRLFHLAGQGPAGWTGGPDHRGHGRGRGRPRLRPCRDHRPGRGHHGPGNALRPCQPLSRAHRGRALSPGE
jgi:agmatinase